MHTAKINVLRDSALFDCIFVEIVDKLFFIIYLVV